MIIVSLILAILTMGVASASENMTMDDVLTDESNQIDIDIEDYPVYEDDNSAIVRIYSSEELSGEVSVNIDDSEYFNEDISKCSRYVNEEYPDFSHYYITQKQLNPNLGIGNYNLTVKYNNLSKNGIITVENMIEISHSIIQGDDDMNLCQIHDSQLLNGTVRIFLDNHEYFNIKLNGEDNRFSSYGFEWTDLKLPKDFQFGIYNVKVIYEKKNGKTYVNEAKLNYDYEFDLSAWDVNTVTTYPKTTFKTDVSVYIHLPSDAKSKVTVKFNGQTYKVTAKDGEIRFKIKNLHLKIGEYCVYATYSDSKYPKRTINSSFTINPSVIYLVEISVGEDEAVHIVVPKDSKGTATLYKAKIVEDEDGDQFLSIVKSIKTVNIVNGHASISLKDLTSGYHHFYLNYTVNGINFGEEMHIEVMKNSKKYSSSISAKKIKVGKTTTLTFKGPKSSTKAKIYLNDKLYKKASLSKGKIKQTFKCLKSGIYKISVRYSKSKVFYSKTFYVTVKAKTIKLTLKKVKVKLSAEKLTIKSALKIDGKKAKNKKIKFKFNKKTYTAKTNNKGIAKITIAKKILKKLKEGQKVTYKSSYGGKTVKQTVKVKR
ncbi:hypothetical protein [Methanobrevibacter sp.]|uniref:hypothetical protein n=1 Tax=Methanobrevibacter sp. TaxID=66852 RepID=UPI0025CB8305|nr:hypothetical protein [Methanobrevibacter sp.]MBR4446883.1 hypothetical protein [Methanobrevibacter sp.]